MYDEHRCLGVHHFQGHRQTSAECIVDQIQQKIRDDSSYRPKEIQQNYTSKSKSYNIIL